MIWTRSNRADYEAQLLADRHYNRQRKGHPQFVPPGRCLVLKAPGAVWVTSWPFPEYVRHAWAGAFVNSLFRNENSGYIASELIRAACSATRAEWPAIPNLGMVTFIDPLQVRDRKVRGRPCIANTYFLAGFTHVGYTNKGLWVMQLQPDRFPDPIPAYADTPLLSEKLGYRPCRINP